MFLSLLYFSLEIKVLIRDRCDCSFCQLDYYNDYHGAIKAHSLSIFIFLSLLSISLYALLVVICIV